MLKSEHLFENSCPKCTLTISRSIFSLTSHFLSSFFRFFRPSSSGSLPLAMSGGGAGRGAKFKKYYEQQPAMPSITSSIVTMLGTGHRLANSAVAPILPDKQREVVGNMWLQLEQGRRESGLSGLKLEGAHGVKGVQSGGGGHWRREERADSVETAGWEDASSNDSEPDIMQEHDDYGCDASRDSNEDVVQDAIKRMTGVAQPVTEENVGKVLGRGRGRPRFRGSLAP